VVHSLAYAGGMRSRAFILCGMTLGAASLPAQTPSLSNPTPYVQASGEATVSAKPDQAVVDIGVVSQATTAAAAAEQNAKQTAAVMADLNRLPATGRKLRTTSYSVRPNYQTAKPGSTPSISGYTVTNIVEVTLDDLDLVSKVLDAATGAGANVIQNLQFQLKDPSAVHAQALQQAAEKAKAAAEAIAAGLGVKVARILSSEEQGQGGPRPVFGAERIAPLAAAAVPTQVEAGSIEVTARVTVRAEISQ
jgi:uncharacterized protein